MVGQAMNRTAKYKLLYCSALILLLAAAVLAAVLLGGGAYAWVVVVVLLLVPGRIQGHYYRELFTARKLLDEGRYAESIPYGERFLAQARSSPWIKRLIWLSWTVYTPDAEAMALNNLGAAHLELGRFDRAASAFEDALVLDPEYAIAYYNLALLRAAQDDECGAAKLLRRAQDLGYRRTNVDQLIGQAQSLLARLEGRGVPAD